MSRMAKTEGRRARHKFTDEFKGCVIRLVLDEGKTAGAVARQLDLTESAVRAWVARAEADRTKGKSGGLWTAEREELARLRKEKPDVGACGANRGRRDVPASTPSRRARPARASPTRVIHQIVRTMRKRALPSIIRAKASDACSRGRVSIMGRMLSRTLKARASSMSIAVPANEP